MAAARRQRSRTQSRGRSGKLALKIALVAGAVGFGGGTASGAFIAGKLASLGTTEAGKQLVSQSYTVAILVGLFVGLAVAGTVYGLANGLGGRLTDLGLAVSKMGRGSKTSVRVSGNDEITVLARALSSLSNDIATQAADEEGGGASVGFDAQVREMRDKVLPSAHIDSIEGFELDAAISAGGRGGTDYFDAHVESDRAVLFLVSCAAASTVGVFAARMARDEIVRALGTGATVRKALSHTNRVLNKHMPRGVCAIATMVEVTKDSVKVYQAGARVPVLLCTAGEIDDLTAEGLGLGLDSGPVFEKGLRSNSIEMRAGMRLVIINEAGNGNDAFVDSIGEHSPKHTTPFMNMVLGQLEADADAGGLREDVVLMTVKRS